MTLTEELDAFRYSASNPLNRIKSAIGDSTKDKFSSISIFLRSEIKIGDCDFLKNFIKNAEIPFGNGLVILHGPGGDTIEALDIAITLREHFNNNLIIVIPRIAGSAMVYITAVANSIILPKTKAYLTTINSTLSEKNSDYNLRLIPRNLLAQEEINRKYSIAECKRTSLEINKIMEDSKDNEQIYSRLLKIRELLSQSLWKASSFSNNTKGDMVNKLFLEEKTLMHEFLDFSDLIDRGFPLNKKCNKKFNNILMQIYDQTTHFMDDNNIFYLIQCDTKLACKYRGL